MKHWKKTADGREIEERLDDQPRIPTVDELEREIEGGGGGGAHAGHDHEQGDRPIPPAQGPEVEIDEHWSNLKLPETPRGEGFFP